MLYFIPAWYQQNQWHENEQKWYRRRMHTEFDDTVKQIQLFHRSKAHPYQILLLGCAPNLRHFLHRQGVYRAFYWSCFDAIQEVRRKKVMMISFHNLNWPPHTEFIYTPFVIVAMLHGVKYAQADFGEDGNLIQVELYENGKLSRMNLYDDRGFVSSTILYEDGKPAYQDYLREDGIWKLRLFYSDGHVEINPKAPEYLLKEQKQEQLVPFSKHRYDTMEEVIAEVFTSYLELTEKNSIFCVAMQEQHALLLNNALRNRKMVLSFFEDRYPIEQQEKLKIMLRRADYIIADSKENRERLLEAAGEQLRIKDITPFDSRVDVGISQQLSVQKILVPVDGMSESVFEQVIQEFGRYLHENENARVYLFTRQADYNRKKELLDKARECLRRGGMEDDWAMQDLAQGEAENLLDIAKAAPVRFFAEQCVDELSVSRCVREQRLIVDMRDVAEVYLRITAISMGIPLIVHARTQFVEHGRNGYVLQDINHLTEILSYYLSSLTNWNEAAVSAYEIGKKYTTNVLLDEWKEVIEFVGQN